MGHTDAIAGLYDVHTFWSSPRLPAALEAHGVPNSHEYVAQERRRVLTELTTAAPYWVAPAICQLIAASGPTFPPSAIDALDLLTPAGWVWFAEPLPLSAALLGPSARDPLRAITWQAVRADLARQQVGLPVDWITLPGTAASTSATDLDRAEGLDIAFYLDLPEQPGLPWLSGRVPWPFGPLGTRSWSSQVNAALEPQIPRALAARIREEAVWHDLARNYFGALLAFLRQRIFTTASKPVHHRGTAKRLRRAGLREQKLRVIQLRQREYVHEDNADPERPKRHYSAQFLVRGHWRQQYYRSSGEHRAKWIQPYVKGDPTKPLKTPPTVFVVKN